GKRGELVVVHGIPLPQKAQEVLVDEIEPEESLVPNARQDVPRGRQQEEKPGSAHETELLPAPPLSAQQEIRSRDQADENDSDQSFGEHGERRRSITGVPPPSVALIRLEGRQKEIQRRADQEGQQRIRYEDTGEKVE